MNNYLHICLPVLNESANIPKLISNLKNQSFSNFTLYACVNQPEDWWLDSAKKHICFDNAKSIKLLAEINDFKTIVIDKSSKGTGWTGKKKGVGWARKISMDLAAESGKSNDIIVTIDADTHYPFNYFQSLVNIFEEHVNIVAHSNPYYHPLTGKREEDEAILRYELYMRVYAIQMLLIHSPYAFSAIGSGMATTIHQYNRMGGISPKQSGEDFYFIQKMVKTGKVNHFNTVKVFPQARFSDRVNFGTGPAMIKGNLGDWSSYPFYSYKLFNDIKETYNSFEELYDEDIETPMTSFLKIQLNRNDIWTPLRKNFKDKKHFVKACIELVDGLRILQYLKGKHSNISQSDEQDFVNSINYFSGLFPDIEVYMKEVGYSGFVFSMENMKSFRDILTNIEYQLRKNKE